MMMKISIITVLILIPFTANAEWTKEDTTGQLVYTILHMVDWGQTRYVAKTPGYSELNPIVGPHPSVGKVNTYFALTLAGHWLISAVLPKEAREFWQATTIVAEGFVVGRNFSLGVGVEF